MKQRIESISVIFIRHSQIILCFRLCSVSVCVCAHEHVHRICMCHAIPYDCGVNEQERFSVYTCEMERVLPESSGQK